MKMDSWASPNVGKKWTWSMFCHGTLGKWCLSYLNGDIDSRDLWHRDGIDGHLYSENWSAYEKCLAMHGPWRLQPGQPSIREFGTPSGCRWFSDIPSNTKRISGCLKICTKSQVSKTFDIQRSSLLVSHQLGSYPSIYPSIHQSIHSGQIIVIH